MGTLSTFFYQNFDIFYILKKKSSIDFNKLKIVMFTILPNINMM